MEDKPVWYEAMLNNQPPRLYSVSDVAIWPYGASIGMREAIACGLPIIIGEDSKVTELVDYNNGLTYREEDSQTRQNKWKSYKTSNYGEEWVIAAENW